MRRPSFLPCSMYPRMVFIEPSLMTAPMLAISEEIAFAGFAGALAAGNEASILFALLNVSQDGFYRAFVDDSAHVGVLGGIAYMDSFDACLQLLEEFVVDALVNNRARTGRALLSLESESGSGNAFHGGIDVRVGVDDDGVLAAHLEDGALDPDLPGALFRGGFVDVQSDLAGSSEGDVASLGMGDDGVTEGGA